MSTPFFQKWHRTLNLHKQTPRAWHRARIIEELAERRNATTPLQRLSETSDVLFSISRSRYDGFSVPLPSHFWSRSRSQNVSVRVSAYYSLAYGYMLAKYTSRWTFYRAAAYLAGAEGWEGVREVVNPRKGGKVDEVAGRHGIERGRFGRVCKMLRRVWPLLP